MARGKLIPPEVRKVLYELHLLSEAARAEIDRVFKDRGLSKRQQLNHMQLIKRAKG